MPIVTEGALICRSVLRLENPISCGYAFGPKIENTCLSIPPNII
jgi:hypothetical protein